MSTRPLSRDRGSLAVLNTGAGDIVVSFENQSAAESDHAIAMLLDMQKRGYAILVKQDDGTYLRAESINATTKSYVVRPPGAVDSASKRRGRPRRAIAEQPVKGRRAVAVARSAGGCAQRSPLAMLASLRSSLLFPSGLR